jgi:dTDP-4-dehydrorhamnose 3,5-epimerase
MNPDRLAVVRLGPGAKSKQKLSSNSRPRAAPPRPNGARATSERFCLKSAPKLGRQKSVDPIEGVRYRLARPVSHRHGHLTEAFRADWGMTDAPVVQVNLTTTFPGRIRAWGIHRFTVDRLFAATGSLCIVCYDGRRGSLTFGCVNEFMLGERNQGLVVIPPGVYHGWKNIGADEATIVSMPSELYDHDGPDRWELPWDSDAAGRMIPYQWL